MVPRRTPPSATLDPGVAAAHDFREIKFIVRFWGIIIALAFAGYVVGSQRAAQGDKYETCLRGNETRAAIRGAFEDVGNAIGHDIRTQYIDPAMRKLADRDCEELKPGFPW